MNKFFYRNIAVFLGISCMTGICAQAAYTDQSEIAMSLRAMHGGYIPADNIHQIYLSPQDVENGATVHFGIYFETDPATVDISYVSAVLESDTATFVKSTFQNPVLTAYDTEQEFTLSDGTVFSTKFKPYCFGRINSMGNYEHAASSGMANVRENSLLMTWACTYGDTDADGNPVFTAHFLGDSSDAYSFIEFDMTIPPGTPAGTYPVNFVANGNFNAGQTYITSDDSVPDEENPGYYKSVYTNFLPALYNAEIIVTEKAPEIQTELVPVFRYAEDTTPFSMQDFPAETVLSYGGNLLEFATDELLEFFPAGSPAELIATPVVLRSELSLSGTAIHDSQGNEAALEYYVGLKGDANRDGKVNALDAALVLVYAANSGSGGQASLTGEDDPVAEQFAYFLADTDGSSLNAADAARILTYAALAGSGQDADWDKLS